MNTSPATFLVWSILCVLLAVFLLGHLWRYDRFKCLKWSNEPYAGAFKRVMTYTYLTEIPLIMSYSIGIAVMKYQEGWLQLPGPAFVPMPYALWSQEHQNALFPLTLVFSFGWALELSTHLEELCFWLFLVNAGPQQPDWFRSPYFKIWAIGSFLALYMPLITLLTRHNQLHCEASTFLAGSVGGLTLTLWFIPILWTFPAFLRSLKKEGVDIAVIVRLTKFYELNVVRVAFRFLFVLPLFVLGVDGVHGSHIINQSVFWTDCLALLAGFGCVISSTITLLIFFPRSYEAEVLARQASREQASVNSYMQQRSRSVTSPATVTRRTQPTVKKRGDDDYPYPPNSLTSRDLDAMRDKYLLTGSPVLPGRSLSPESSIHAEQTGVGLETGTGTNTEPEADPFATPLAPLDDAAFFALMRKQDEAAMHAYTYAHLNTAAQPRARHHAPSDSVYAPSLAPADAPAPAYAPAAPEYADALGHPPYDPLSGFLRAPRRLPTPPAGTVPSPPSPSRLLPAAPALALTSGTTTSPTSATMTTAAPVPMRLTPNRAPGLTPSTPPPPPTPRSSRGEGSGGGGGMNMLRQGMGLTHRNLQRHTLDESGLNPLVHSFTSPIDLMNRAAPRTRDPRV